MTRRLRTMTALLLGAAALAAFGCSKLGPQKPAEPPSAEPKGVYIVDLTKPDGPLNQIMKAAQERDLTLFKASFAPSVDTAKVDEVAFRKFRKKVLTNKISPVPESVTNVSDSEAIVKLRNARGREVPVHVQKIDGKWFISGIDFGEKTKQRFNDRQKTGAPPDAGQKPNP
ncbi:MAG TPA: hypothetical protein PLF26_13635 [Blastocatellia bacterium]|nr:hypothetical protein [Blastocatellia bacterium]